MEPFSREQISFKERFRILEELDMQRATEKVVNYFITKNGEEPKNYKVEVARVKSDLFDDNYEWNRATAQGIIHSTKEDYPFKVNLTDGQIWTVTLEV